MENISVASCPFLLKTADTFRKYNCIKSWKQCDSDLDTHWACMREFKWAKQDILSGNYFQAHSKLSMVIYFDEDVYGKFACINYHLGLVYAQLLEDTSLAKHHFLLAYRKYPDVYNYKLALDAMNIDQIIIGLQFYMLNSGRQLANYYSKLIDMDEYLARGYSHFPVNQANGYNVNGFDNSGIDDPNLIFQNNAFISDLFNLSRLYFIISDIENRIYYGGAWLLFIKFDATGSNLNIKYIKFETEIVHPDIDEQGFITESAFCNFIKQTPCVHQIISRIKLLLNNVMYIEGDKGIQSMREVATIKNVQQEVINRNLICIFCIRKQLYTLTTKYPYSDYMMSKIKKIIISRFCRIHEGIYNIIIPDDIHNIICIFYCCTYGSKASPLLRTSFDFNALFYELTGRRWHFKLIDNPLWKILQMK